MNKTRMSKAANHSGMKNAVNTIWVKYPLSLFHNNYVNKYRIILIKIKEKSDSLLKNINQNEQ
jgi:hypothetical protein